MALSDTALRVLTEASQDSLRLATPPKQPPRRRLHRGTPQPAQGRLRRGMPGPFEFIGLGWRQQDGAWTALRVTDAGLLAIGVALPAAPEEIHSAPPTASAGPEGQQVPPAADAAPEAGTAAPA
jgi:hypothetical protein